ncbi:MAG: quinol:cytochrome C oxidoreductase [Ignavibacteriaceae bacterium]
MSKTNSGYVKKDLPGGIMKIGSILLAAGLLLGIIAFVTNPERSTYGYLVTFMFIISIGIGSLFLVALEYIVNADWSVPFRRIMEFLASVVPFLLILAIPLLLNMHSLFHWSHPEVVANDEVLKGKAPYLNTTFFVLRVIGIFIIWSLFYFVFTKNSRKQDTTDDQGLTKKNTTISGIFMPVFAITLTMTAIDWMMSLEPHWFSTIFGVYYFAGSVLSALAAITLIAIFLNKKGFLHSGIHNDHYYSLGTLMFAFTTFWGYIAFSQYMLIWYADLPEETFWFMHRWEGVWVYISILLIVTHFIVPFGALLSYQAKTNTNRLKFMTIWILAAHYLDLYWLIMPNISSAGHGFAFSWTDFVFPIFAVGLLMVLFDMNAKKWNLVPIGDPKLQRGLDFQLYSAYYEPSAHSSDKA